MPPPPCPRRGWNVLEVNRVISQAVQGLQAHMLRNSLSALAATASRCPSACRQSTHGALVWSLIRSVRACVAGAAAAPHSDRRTRRSLRTYGNGTPAMCSQRPAPLCKRDYYDVLGVSKGAAAGDVKQAYYKVVGLRCRYSSSYPEPLTGLLSSPNKAAGKKIPPRCESGQSGGVQELCGAERGLRGGWP